MKPMSNGKVAALLCCGVIALLASACAKRSAPATAHRGPDYRATGEASWYGPGFAGRKTASGERFNPRDLTAAHRKLPFGTKVKVTHVENGRSVVVRINDRGPYAGRRIIDLSKAAAREIDMLRSGTATVEVMTLASVDAEKEQEKELMQEEEALRSGTPPPQPEESSGHKKLPFNPPVDEDHSTSEQDLYEQEQVGQEAADIPGEMEEF